MSSAGDDEKEYPMVADSNPKPAEDPLAKADEALKKVDEYKKRYDILKWVSGIAIGIISGVFFAGVYYSQFRSFIAKSTVPPDMVAFFLSADCPAEWTRADEMRGRYAVGIDPSHLKEVGANVGQALTHGENRPAGSHTHTAVNTVPEAGGGRDQMMGGGRGGFQDPRMPTDGGTDPGGRPLVAGTNAPYVLLSACRSPKP